MNIRHYILLVLLMFACCGKIAANDEYKFASFMTTAVPRLQPRASKGHVRRANSFFLVLLNTQVWHR